MFKKILTTESDTYIFVYNNYNSLKLERKKIKIEIHSNFFRKCLSYLTSLHQITNGIGNPQK